MPNWAKRSNLSKAHALHCPFGQNVWKMGKTFLEVGKKIYSCTDRRGRHSTSPTSASLQQSTSNVKHDAWINMLYCRADPMSSTQAVIPVQPSPRQFTEVLNTICRALWVLPAVMTCYCRDCCNCIVNLLSDLELCSHLSTHTKIIIPSSTHCTVQIIIPSSTHCTVQ